MNPNKKYLTYFEYYAAHLYYSDVKLHLSIDQADSGFHLEEGDWETGIKNPIKKLNFNKLWEELDDEQKQFYIKLARHEFNNEPEIKHR